MFLPSSEFITVVHREVCSHIREKILEEQASSHMPKLINRSLSDSINSTPSMTFAATFLCTEISNSMIQSDVAGDSCSAITLLIDLSSIMRFSLDSDLTLFLAVWGRSSTVCLFFPATLILLNTGETKVLKKLFSQTGVL